MSAKHIFIVGVLVFGGWIFASCGGESESKKGTDNRIAVHTAIVKMVNQPQTFSFSGKVEAEQHSSLSTRIMGQIANVLVEPGQMVKAGELIVQIHNADILAKNAQVKATLAETEAAYLNAEKDYKRFRVLIEQKSVSQKEMDDIATNYNMAKARIDAVKEMQTEVGEMIRYADIKAPYSGVITHKYVNKGDMALPGMPLVAIEKRKHFKVVARVPESEIALVKKGDVVMVHIDVLSDIIIRGMVSDVNPSALYTGSQYEVKVELQPSSQQIEEIYSGMYASVMLRKGEKQSIMIPRSALIKRGQLSGLYTVSQEGTAMLRWVRTGKITGDSIEIISGLAEGEQYILSFEGKIWDGAKIKQ